MILQEQGVEQMLNNWEAFLQEEGMTVTLKEYVSHMRSLYKGADWRQSEVLMSRFLKFVREHAGEKDVKEDAKLLHKIAQDLEKKSVEISDWGLAIQLYLEEARIFEQSGEKAKAKSAYRAAQRNSIYIVNEAVHPEKGILNPEEWTNPYRMMKGDEVSSADPFKIWENEQIYENPWEFFERIASFKVIPPYKQVLVYLLDVCGIYICKVVREQFFTYVENGFELKDESGPGTQEGYDNLFAKLSQCIQTRFEENGFVREEEQYPSWDDYFRGLVLDFSFRYLRDLALGTHMQPKHLNWFLMNVLKRSHINFYKSEEVYLYLTLQYSKETDRFFDNYRALKKLYPDVKKKNIQKVANIHLGEWKTAGIRTRNVQEVLQGFLVKEEKVESLFREANEQLQKFFGWINRLESQKHIRSTEETFFQQVEELKYLLLESKRFRAFRKDREVFRYLSKAESAKNRTVEICCEKDEGVEIMAGALFSCPVRLPEGEEKAKAYFKAIKDIEIRKDDLVDVQVRVRALTDELVLERYKKVKRLKNLPNFVKEQHVRGNGFRPVDEKHKELLSDIYLLETGGALAFTATQDKGKGKLGVRGKAGTIVPAGMQIYFEEIIEGEAIRFVYEVTESVTLEKKVEAELVWLNAETLWHNPEGIEGKEIASTNTRLFLEKEAEELVCGSPKIFLKKPLKLHRPGESWDEIEDKLEQRERKGGIRKRSAKKQGMPEISNLELLEFIYNAPADNTSYYQGIKGYNSEFLLNSPMFLETRLKNDILDNFVRTEGMRQRNLILTVIFLVYALECLNVNYTISNQRRCLDFEMFVEEVMESCGLQGFRIDNPYDAFLELLLCCEEPLELYCNIWSSNSPFVS